MNRSAALHSSPDRQTSPVAAGCSQTGFDSETLEKLGELQRLWRVGVRCIGEFDAMLDGASGVRDVALFIRRRGGIVSEYVRLVRAVRQVMILEQELKGLRPPRQVRAIRSRPAAPAEDREDDLHEPRDTGTARDRDDSQDSLDCRPIGEAVAWIRRALGAPRPERDPFGSPPEPAPAAREPGAAAPNPPDSTPPRSVCGGGQSGWAAAANSCGRDTIFRFSVTDRSHGARPGRTGVASAAARAAVIRLRRREPGQAARSRTAPRQLATTPRAPIGRHFLRAQTHACDDAIDRRHYSVMTGPGAVKARTP